MDPALLELVASGAWDDEVAVIVRLRPGYPPPPALRLVARFGDVATGRATRGLLAAIHEHPAVASLKAPRVYAAENRVPFADRPPPLEPGLSEADPAPIDSDERRPPGLTETGRGTVCAVIDWGLDFAHPDFRNPDGSTRLLGLWDQRAQGAPAPYGYGKVHGPRAIDAALKVDDPFAALGYQPSTGAQPSHGTHVLGIAAGNGRAGGPAGVAPESKLVFVHLGPGLGDLGNSIDLLEAVDFVICTAGELPVALNMSIGRHAGPHDGTLLIERAIDWLIVNRPGTVVVQSTGNYYSRRTHMEGRLREAMVAQLPFVVPRSDAQPVTIELWYQGADRFAARVRSPDGVAIIAWPGTNSALVSRSGDQIGRLYNRLNDPNNGDNLIALVLRPPVAMGDWLLEVEGLDVIDGRWHAWIERNAACPPCQALFAADAASPNTTTGSICNAMRTIAVGAYDGHDPEFPLARFSSVGPTRDGRCKPLLAAPGVRILSVRSRLSAAEQPSYVRMSGTSMAAPHVTGTAALMLEAAGRQPIAAIRHALFSTLAPPGPAPPDQQARWGYGILDIAAAVTAARRLDSPPSPATHRAPARAVAESLIEEVCPMDEHDESATAGPIAGPPVTREEQVWTKGRRANLMTPEQRVLSQFSDAELRDMLDLPPAPPIAVAMRESENEPAPPADPAAPTSASPFEPTAPEPVAPEPAAPEPAATTAELPAADPGAEPAAPPATPAPPPLAADPKALVKVAIDPQSPGTQVVGFPGTRLIAPLLAGDIILRGNKKRRARIVRRAGVKRARQLARRAGRPRESGLYAEVLGDEAVERIAGPDGLLLPDVTIIRSILGMEGTEVDPPLVARPTVRQGSRGTAVSEAQTRLNAVHASRVAAGQGGLDRCPLAVDGAFGSNTRAAVVAFQRTAFPNQPREWDGIVGPHSWAALIAASESGGGGDDQRLPSRCPGLPERQDINQFEFNSSDVLPRHQPQIVGIARCIIESQRTSTPIRHLRLIGHTDPIGGDPDNVALGLRRAEAIRREILAAIARISGRPAPSTLVIDIESRGEREQRGTAAESRRVEVFSDFAFDPSIRPPPPQPVATIEFVLDPRNNHAVDGSSPVATALMFGLFDQGYDRTTQNLLNGAAETANFVGTDVRRFYLRVRDAAATGPTVTARWRTADGSGANDDAPADQTITLSRSAAGIYVSRALILVTNEVDLALRVHSGLTSGGSAGLRRRGQSDFRLRRGRLDGNVLAEYTPAAGGRASVVTLPVFQRRPDQRRRLTVDVVHYGITPDATIRRYINEQFERARIRWMQTGLHIERGTTIDRAIVASARDAAGNYTGTRLSQREADACNDLMRVVPDRTVTVCYCRLPASATFGAYATRQHNPLMDLEERFFIFMGLGIAIDDDTLAHELHHVIFNRGDEPSLDPFFTFNTTATADIAARRGLTLPDAHISHRVHTEHADPNNDPRVESIANWMRRRRTRRYNQPGNTHPFGRAAPDATTGNILTRPF